MLDFSDLAETGIFIFIIAADLRRNLFWCLFFDFTDSIKYCLKTYVLVILNEKVSECGECKELTWESNRANLAGKLLLVFVRQWYQHWRWQFYIWTKNYRLRIQLKKRNISWAISVTEVILKNDDYYIDIMFLACLKHWNELANLPLDIEVHL